MKRCAHFIVPLLGNGIAYFLSTRNNPYFSKISFSKLIPLIQKNRRLKFLNLFKLIKMILSLILMMKPGAPTWFFTAPQLPFQSSCTVVRGLTFFVRFPVLLLYSLWYRPYALTSRLHNNGALLGVKTCRAARTCCAGRAHWRSASQSVRGPGPARRYGYAGVALWLHAWRRRTWQCQV